MMIITKQAELDKICKDFSKYPFITLDTEFLREKTYYPKLCLIQMSDPEGNAVAIDPLEGSLKLDYFFELLSNKNVLKVLHAARQDLEIFYNLTGKVVEPFYDTQIAAMVCGYGDSIGYDSLVRNITHHTLDKSVQFTDWSKRPLSKKQLEYALGDVIYLVDVYLHLSQYLEDRNRTSWLYQEEEILADPKTYENDPYNAWEKVKIKSPKPKTLSVLKEIAAWREKKAQDQNIPKTWVLRDDTLADMASQMPKDVSALKKIRNMPKDLAQGSVGQELLCRIEKGLKASHKEKLTPKKRKIHPAHIGASIDVLKMLLKIQCAEHEVAPKLVASAQDIETLALGENEDIPALKGWRFEIFGRYAQALKNGELAIGLKGSKISKFHTSSKSNLYE